MNFDTDYFDWIAGRIGVAPESLWRVAATAGFVILYLIVRTIASHTLANTVTDRTVRFRALTVVTRVLVIMTIILIARVWMREIGGLSTYLGLLSAGLAVALQEPIVNLVGFAFILWRRPFEVGNRIEIGPHAGDVIDVSLFQFTMLEIGKWVKADQSTGRILHIPNGWVFRHPVANFSKGFDHIWNEMAVTVTFESNWRKAKTILGEVLATSGRTTEETVRAQLDASSNPYVIKFSNLSPIVWTLVSEDGIVLTMRYMCNPRQRRSSETELWEQVLDRFAQENDIEIAYRTTRMFQNAIEGKPGARVDALSAPPSAAVVLGAKPGGSAKPND